MTQVLVAAKHLLSGGLVAFPTETVYGLGADAENENAVARIYSTKGRPADHPLIIHIADKEQIAFWAIEVPDYAHALAEAYWPGPMTLILKRSESAKDFVTGGQDSVGLRIPNHQIALELLMAFKNLGGQGVAAPSANRFGKVSPTTSEAVREELGSFLQNDDLILDGGPSMVGIESTIIDCTGLAPRILRPGSITASMIEQVSNSKLIESQSTIRVSGALENHYAPNAMLVLDEQPLAGDGFIAMGNIETPEGVIRLASPDTLELFAQVLYDALRKADQQQIRRVVAWQPPGDGLAIAIRDRLQKASTKTN